MQTILSGHHTFAADHGRAIKVPDGGMQPSQDPVTAATVCWGGLAIRIGNPIGGTGETVMNVLDERSCSGAPDQPRWTVWTTRMGLRKRLLYLRERPSDLGVSIEPIFSAASRSDSSTKCA